MRVPEVPVSKKSNVWQIVVPSVVVAVAFIAGGLYYRSQRAKPLTEKDTIVLADFENRTGDSVFDDTLKQALAMQLEQSPFISVLPDNKVKEALGLMGRRGSDRLTQDIAREVCVRTGSKALLAGSVASFGSHYMVGVRAVNCESGESLGSAEAEADGRTGRSRPKRRDTTTAEQTGRIAGLSPNT